MKSATVLAVAAAVALQLAGAAALATPSTTYWAPSTTYVQPFLVPHLSFDAFFGRGAVPGAGRLSPAGAENPPLYPILTGLTLGVLPWEPVQLEIGFDLLLPTRDPVLFNAKLGTPEGTFFTGSPSLAVGIYGVGTRAGATDFTIVYGQIQKTFPWGGYVSAGGYYGAGSTRLWTSSGGAVNRGGFMGALALPDINLDLPGLKKLVLVGDVQTGENVFGAVGGGVYFYFTDAIDVLTGPVFFFDGNLQPGGESFLWTVQLDVDVRLFGSAKEEPRPSSPAPGPPLPGSPAPAPPGPEAPPAPASPAPPEPAPAQVPPAGRERRQTPLEHARRRPGRDARPCYGFAE